MQSAFHQIFEAPTSHFAFARGNWNRRSGAELSIASKVILRERFLQPTDIELLQQPGALQRSLNLKRLSRIDHHIPRIPGGSAGGLHVREILSQVLAEWPPAKLHRGEPQVDRLPREFACFRWRVEPNR